MTSTPNINWTASNRATLEIAKLPIVSFTSTEYSLPGLSLPPAEASIPKGYGKEPGDKIQFDELTVTFLVTEDLSNWKEIYKWMMSNGAPKSYSQYNHSGRFSDGTLIIYSSHNNPILKYKFYEMHPINLTSIDFSEEDSDTIVKKASVTFAYLFYELEN